MSTNPDPYRMVRLNAGAATIVEQITGDRPSSATMYRWAQRGLKGVTLRTAFAGGHRRTTEAWIREFFADITEAVDGTAIAPPKASTRSEQIAAAERELEKAGL